MVPLVIELQRDALDSSKLVSDILRKALVTAKKLDLEDLRIWIESELNGYSGESPKPEYRRVRGRFEVFNPYHGWQPLMYSDAGFAEAFSKRFVSQPIGQIEHILSRSEKNGVLQMPTPSEIEQKLVQGADLDYPPAWMVDRSQIFGIVDAVRNVILDWALKLEKAGVLGEGMRFSEQEEKIASSQIYNIEMMIGQVSGSQIQQHVVTGHQALHASNTEELRTLLADLKQAITKQELSKDREEEATAEIQTIEHQLKSPKPKDKIIIEALRSLRSVAEDVAGSAVFAELAKRISDFVS